MSFGTHIMFDEPELLSGDLRISNESSIVADQCLEFTTQRVSLDPIDHEATITGASCHAAVGVNEVEVIADILPALDQIIVRIAALEVVSEGFGKDVKQYIPQLFAIASVSASPNPVLPVGFGATTTYP